MRIVVLAGSGLSIGAGYPCTEALTKTILSGQGAFRHTDGAWHLSGGSDPAGKMVLEFLHRLGKLVTAYYATEPDRPVNYEDLAYVAGQFADSESREYDNPALGPLHDSLRAEIKAILDGGGQDANSRGNPRRPLQSPPPVAGSKSSTRSATERWEVRSGLSFSQPGLRPPSVASSCLRT